MRVVVDWTRDISHESKSKSDRSKMSGYVHWSVGWSLVPRTFPRMSCFLVLLPALFAALCGVRVKTEKRPHSTHGQLATPVALNHRVDPTSELVIYAPASSLAEPPPAANPLLGHGGSVSRGCDPRGCVVCCWCLLLLPVLLLRCCCCFDDDCC